MKGVPSAIPPRQLMHGFPRPLIAPVDPLNGCGVGGCGRLRQLRIEAYVRNTRRMNCTNVRHSRRGASPLARAGRSFDNLAAPLRDRSSVTSVATVAAVRRSIKSVMDLPSGARFRRRSVPIINRDGAQVLLPLPMGCSCEP